MIKVLMATEHGIVYSFVTALGAPIMRKDGTLLTGNKE